MVLGVHGGEKIGGGFVVWAGLSGDPVEAEAVAEAAEHSHEEHGAGCAHAAEVVEVADVEAVVESAFDAPGLAVELEPVEGGEFFGGAAGEEFDGVGGFAVGDAKEAGGLAGEGEVQGFGVDGGGAQDSDFVAAFVELAAAGGVGAGGEVVAGAGGFFLESGAGGGSAGLNMGGGSSMRRSRVWWRVDWLSLTVRR